MQFAHFVCSSFFPVHLIFKLQFKYHLKIIYLKPFSTDFFFHRMPDLECAVLSAVLTFFCRMLSFSFVQFLLCASSSLSLFKCFEINIMVDFCCYLLVSLNCKAGVKRRGFNRHWTLSLSLSLSFFQTRDNSTNNKHVSHLFLSFRVERLARYIYLLTIFIFSIFMLIAVFLHFLGFIQL